MAAFLSCIAVPLDNLYWNYIDFRTLACLFSTLLVVGAFKNLALFEIIARNLVTKLKGRRALVLTVVFITYFGSMILANDMALLTFLPLGYFVLQQSGNEAYMLITFIMQNIAANLGGMLTPFGNPQNIFLYSYYMLQPTEFMQIMLPPFLVATVLIIACCLGVKNEPIKSIKSVEYHLNKPKAAIYTILFIVAVLIVFRIFDYKLGTLFIALSIFVLDKSAFRQVDYALLCTFLSFFIFVGNIARLDIVHNALATLVQQHTLLVGVLSCQLISNVPSAILLSHFTRNYQALLVAVNIGGCGTLIASLASLITYYNFRYYQRENTARYVCYFTLYNFSFLGILYLVAVYVQKLS